MPSSTVTFWAFLSSAGGRRRDPLSRGRYISFIPVTALIATFTRENSVLSNKDNWAICYCLR
jgi:hypothetical protein